MRAIAARRSRPPLHEFTSNLTTGGSVKRSLAMALNAPCKRSDIEEPAAPKLAAIT
jgi:hypothetical protein